MGRHGGHRARRARRYRGTAKRTREEAEQFPGYELSATLARDLHPGGPVEPDAGAMRQAGAQDAEEDTGLD